MWHSRLWRVARPRHCSPHALGRLRRIFLLYRSRVPPLQYFKYIKWAVSDFSDAPLRTNDQWLSLTDQLNLGVRALELDAHWVGVSHSGGQRGASAPSLRFLADGSLGGC